MKVDFMIIGAMKSGTSSLSYQLKQHPQVCFSDPEEPHFFSDRRDAWRKHLAWYEGLFSPKPGQVCGEGSTSYTQYPWNGDVAARIHAYNPDVKLIYLMRHPVERAVSHFSHRCLHGRDNPAIPGMVLGNGMYVCLSRYAIQLGQYLALFRREQMLPIVFEEMIADPAATFRAVLQFLELDAIPTDRIDFSPRNVTLGRSRIKPFPGSYLLAQIAARSPLFVKKRIMSRLLTAMHVKPQIPPNQRVALWRLVEDDVRWVEKFVGRKLPWEKPAGA